MNQITAALAMLMGVPNFAVVESGDEAFDREFDIHCDTAHFAKAVFDEAGRDLFYALMERHDTKMTQFCVEGSRVSMMIDYHNTPFDIADIDIELSAEKLENQFMATIPPLIEIVDDMQELLERGYGNRK